MPPGAIAALLVLAVASVVAAAGGVVVVLAAVFVVAFLRRRAPRAGQEPERIDDEVLARLLVLRVFLVARRAGWRTENKLRSVAVVRLEDPALRDPNAPRGVVMRGLFYALLLEELDRRGGHSSRRRPARKLGSRLGRHDPYPLYLRMVEAAPSDDLQAATALGVTAAEVELNRRFLYELPVQRWQ